MRISDLLLSIASWLESPNNEAILLSEYNEDCLKVVSESCVEAASALRKAASTVDNIEPAEESKITPESIESLAELATALDESGIEDLQKQASVLDELLLTIAAPPNAYADKMAASDDRLEQLKKKYQDVNKDLGDKNKTADAAKAIEKSPAMKECQINDHPLQTKYCPDHPGAPMARVGENEFQCDLDKKIYNYEVGYTLNDGTKVPGGSVQNQSNMIQAPVYENLFDDRVGRLQSNKA